MVERARALGLRRTGRTVGSVAMRTTRARSASRRRLAPAVSAAGSGAGEERRVAVCLAVFFGCLALLDALVVAFVAGLRQPAILLLVYLLSLVAVLLVALRPRRAASAAARPESALLRRRRSSAT